MSYNIINVEGGSRWLCSPGG